MQHGCSPIASRFLFSGPESPIKKKNTHWLVMYHFLATSKAILLFLKKSLFRSHFSPAICNSIPCALPGPNVCLQLGGNQKSGIGVVTELHPRSRPGAGAPPVSGSGHARPGPGARLVHGSRRAARKSCAWAQAYVAAARRAGQTRQGEQAPR